MLLSALGQSKCHTHLSLRLWCMVFRTGTAPEVGLKGGGGGISRTGVGFVEEKCLWKRLKEAFVIEKCLLKRRVYGREMFSGGVKTRGAIARGAVWFVSKMDQKAVIVLSELYSRGAKQVAEESVNCKE